ncbi:MAG: cobalamin biosynthesis protein, partial [Candidatus Electrothrix sp. EH2]|nr:cobalamin biosynthesis protein [Candidatus Electrothrix sp. EH2]
ALPCRRDMNNSLRILIRDRRQHSSPNAGWPEAAMAGALGLQLGGDSSYFGKVIKKASIGDALAAPAAHHIFQANSLVLTASLLGLCLFSLCYALLIFTL